MQIIEAGYAPRRWPVWLKIFGIVVFFGGLLVGSLVWRVQTKYADKILLAEEVVAPQVGLVFGAGLKARGVPGAVLEDRILTAVKLYQLGKISKFIMSGDNTQVNHNEVQAMKNFALEQGLPEASLLLDHAGASTYDSCVHLREEFGLTQIVLITQEYHLRRALYYCNESGIEAYGVAAQDRGYARQWRYTWREFLASLMAWGKMVVN